MVVKDSLIFTLTQKVDLPVCYSNVGTFLCLCHHSADTFLGKGGGILNESAKELLKWSGRLYEVPGSTSSL